MADSGAPRNAILGGGISGLSAAFRLQELSAKHEDPLEVTLLERSPRLGGAPVRFMSRDSSPRRAPIRSSPISLWRSILCACSVSTASRPARRAEFRRTYVVHNGALVEIPDGSSLLAPTRMLPMLRSPLLSSAARQAPRDDRAADSAPQRASRRKPGVFRDPPALPRSPRTNRTAARRRNLHRRPGAAQFARHAATLRRYGGALRQRDPRPAGGRAQARRRIRQNPSNWAAPAARDGACAFASMRG